MVCVSLIAQPASSIPLTGTDRTDNIWLKQSLQTKTISRSITGSQAKDTEMRAFSLIISWTQINWSWDGKDDYISDHICFKCVQRLFWPKTFSHFCWSLAQLSVWHFPILDWVWNSVQRQEEEMSGSKWAVKRKVAHRTQKWTQLNCCCNILQLGHCAMCCIGWHWCGVGVLQRRLKPASAFSIPLILTHSRPLYCKAHFVWSATDFKWALARAANLQCRM